MHALNYLNPSFLLIPSPQQLFPSFASWSLILIDAGKAQKECLSVESPLGGVCLEEFFLSYENSLLKSEKSSILAN